MYNVSYHLWIEVRGNACLDFEPQDPNDLIDYLFSDECDCEVWDVTDRLNTYHEGYMVVEPDDDEPDPDDDVEDD